MGEGKGEGSPALSPLTGAYLLVILPQTHANQHLQSVLHKLTKGLVSWDTSSCHVDLYKELETITSQGPEGELVKHGKRLGERLIQFASENLVTEVLIHPQLNTVVQCLRNLLSSFTRHRHIIHAGYTYSGNGSWILQDGTFSFADFHHMFQEIDVQRVLVAYENTVTMDIHCCQEGDWANVKVTKEPFAKLSRLSINPSDKISVNDDINHFTEYLRPYILSYSLEQLLEPSDVVGNIRFSHPTLYVFPGGQGDAALFGINGFNMLVDGGFSRKTCFWDFTRHLDRLDAALVTRLNNGNIQGISSFLQRKRMNHVYPQIGHFFCNIQDRKHPLSPDGDKDRDPMLINIIDQGQELVTSLQHLNLKPQPCYRDSSMSPINLYHKVGHGKLDMYVLSPAKDSREVKDFIARWNANDIKLFATINKKSGEFSFPLPNRVSICALLVWQPANPNDNITRLLFPGSTPQHKIMDGLEKIKHLDYLKYPTCSAKSLSPSSSTIGLNIRQSTKQKPHTDKPVQPPVSEIKPLKIPEPIKTPKIDQPDSKLKSQVRAKKITDKHKEEKIKEKAKEEKGVKEEKPKEEKEEIAKDEATEKAKEEEKIEENEIEKEIVAEKVTESEKDLRPIEHVEGAPRQIEIEIAKEVVPDAIDNENIISEQKENEKILEKNLENLIDSRKDTKTDMEAKAELISAETDKPKKEGKSDKQKTDAVKKNDRVVKKKEHPEKSDKLDKEDKPKRTVTRKAEKRVPKPPPKGEEKKSESAKSSPTTPKKTPVPKVMGEPKTRPLKSRPSPSATPAKSTKEENNRKVMEQRAQKIAKKEEVKKTERRPLTRKTVAETARETKKSLSPVKAVSKTKPRKAPPHDKESKPTTAPAPSTQPPPKGKAIKGKKVANNEIKIISDIIKDADLVNGDASLSKEEDEILIVEKIELELYPEEIPSEEKEAAADVGATDEAEKIEAAGLKQADAEEIREEVTGIIETATDIVLKAKTPDEPEKAIKDRFPTKEPEKDQKEKSNEMEQKQQAEESHPDEKFSATVESGATTTAPTLPEDERIPIEEVKEGIEEKHVKEETKEKDQQQRPEQFETKVQEPVVTTFDQKAQILRDIVKTPDEVADLPVHEVADYETGESAARETAPDETVKHEEMSGDELKFIKDGLEKEDKSKDLKEDQKTSPVKVEENVSAVEIGEELPHQKEEASPTAVTQQGSEEPIEEGVLKEVPQISSTPTELDLKETDEGEKEIEYVKEDNELIDEVEKADKEAVKEVEVTATSVEVVAKETEESTEQEKADSKEATDHVSEKQFTALESGTAQDVIQEPEEMAVVERSNNLKEQEDISKESAIKENISDVAEESDVTIAEKIEQAKDETLKQSEIESDGQPKLEEKTQKQLPQQLLDETKQIELDEKIADEKDEQTEKDKKIAQDKETDLDDTIKGDELVEKTKYEVVEKETPKDSEMVEKVDEKHESPTKEHTEKEEETLKPTDFVEKDDEKDISPIKEVSETEKEIPKDSEIIEKVDEKHESPTKEHTETEKEEETLKPTDVVVMEDEKDKSPMKELTETEKEEEPPKPKAIIEKDDEKDKSPMKELTETEKDEETPKPTTIVEKEDEKDKSPIKELTEIEKDEETPKHSEIVDVDEKDKEPVKEFSQADKEEEISKHSELVEKDTSPIAEEAEAATPKDSDIILKQDYVEKIEEKDKSPMKEDVDIKASQIDKEHAKAIEDEVIEKDDKESHKVKDDEEYIKEEAVKDAHEKEVKTDLKGAELIKDGIDEQSIEIGKEVKESYQESNQDLGQKVLLELNIDKDVKKDEDSKKISDEVVEEKKQKEEHSEKTEQPDLKKQDDIQETEEISQGETDIKVDEKGKKEDKEPELLDEVASSKEDPIKQDIEKVDKSESRSKPESDTREDTNELTKSGKEHLKDTEKVGDNGSKIDTDSETTVTINKVTKSEKKDLEDIIPKIEEDNKTEVAKSDPPLDSKSEEVVIKSEDSLPAKEDKELSKDIETGDTKTPDVTASSTSVENEAVQKPGILDDIKEQATEEKESSEKEKYEIENLDEKTEKKITKSDEKVSTSSAQTLEEGPNAEKLEVTPKKDIHHKDTDKQVDDIGKDITEPKFKLEEKAAVESSITMESVEESAITEVDIKAVETKVSLVTEPIDDITKPVTEISVPETDITDKSKSDEAAHITDHSNELTQESKEDASLLEKTKNEYQEEESVSQPLDASSIAKDEKEEESKPSKVYKEHVKEAMLLDDDVNTVEETFKPHITEENDISNDKDSIKVEEITKDEEKIEELEVEVSSKKNSQENIETKSASVSLVETKTSDQVDANAAQQTAQSEEIEITSAKLSLSGEGVKIETSLGKKEITTVEKPDKEIKPLTDKSLNTTTSDAKDIEIADLASEPENVVDLTETSGDLTAYERQETIDIKEKEDTQLKKTETKKDELTKEEISTENASAGIELQTEQKSSKEAEEKKSMISESVIEKETIEADATTEMKRDTVDKKEESESDTKNQEKDDKELVSEELKAESKTVHLQGTQKIEILENITAEIISKEEVPVEESSTIEERSKDVKTHKLHSELSEEEILKELEQEIIPLKRGKRSIETEEIHEKKQISHENLPPKMPVEEKFEAVRLPYTKADVEETIEEKSEQTSQIQDNIKTSIDEKDEIDKSLIGTTIGTIVSMCEKIAAEIIDEDEKKEERLEVSEFKIQKSDAKEEKLESSREVKAPADIGQVNEAVVDIVHDAEKVTSPILQEQLDITLKLADEISSEVKTEVYTEADDSSEKKDVKQDTTKLIKEPEDSNLSDNVEVKISKDLEEEKPSKELDKCDVIKEQSEDKDEVQDTSTKEPLDIEVKSQTETEAAKDTKILALGLTSQQEKVDASETLSDEKSNTDIKVDSETSEKKYEKQDTYEESRSPAEYDTTMEGESKITEETAKLTVSTIPQEVKQAESETQKDEHSMSDIKTDASKVALETSEMQDSGDIKVSGESDTSKADTRSEIHKDAEKVPVSTEVQDIKVEKTGVSEAGKSLPDTKTGDIEDATQEKQEKQETSGDKGESAATLSDRSQQIIDIPKDIAEHLIPQDASVDVSREIVDEKLRTDIETKTSESAIEEPTKKDDEQETSEKIKDLEGPDKISEVVAEKIENTERKETSDITEKILERKLADEKSGADMKTEEREIQHTSTSEKKDQDVGTVEETEKEVIIDSSVSPKKEEKEVVNVTKKSESIPPTTAVSTEKINEAERISVEKVEDQNQTQTDTHSTVIEDTTQKKTVDEVMTQDSKQISEKQSTTAGADLKPHDEYQTSEMIASDKPSSFKTSDESPAIDSTKPEMPLLDEKDIHDAVKEKVSDTKETTKEQIESDVNKEFLLSTQDKPQSSQIDFSELPPQQFKGEEIVDTPELKDISESTQKEQDIPTLSEASVVNAKDSKIEVQTDGGAQDTKKVAAQITSTEYLEDKTVTESKPSLDEEKSDNELKLETPSKIESADKISAEDFTKKLSSKEEITDTRKVTSVELPSAQISQERTDKGNISGESKTDEINEKSDSIPPASDKCTSKDLVDKLESASQNIEVDKQEASKDQKSSISLEDKSKISDEVATSTSIGEKTGEQVIHTDDTLETDEITPDKHESEDSSGQTTKLEISMSIKSPTPQDEDQEISKGELSSSTVKDQDKNQNDVKSPDPSPKKDPATMASAATSSKDLPQEIAPEQIVPTNSDELNITHEKAAETIEASEDTVKKSTESVMEDQSSKDISHSSRVPEDIVKDDSDRSAISESKVSGKTPSPQKEQTETTKISEFQTDTSELVGSNTEPLTKDCQPSDISVEILCKDSKTTEAESRTEEKHSKIVSTDESKEIESSTSISQLIENSELQSALFKDIKSTSSSIQEQVSILKESTSETVLEEVKDVVEIKDTTDSKIISVKDVRTSITDTVASDETSEEKEKQSSTEVILQETVSQSQIEQITTALSAQQYDDSSSISAKKIDDKLKQQTSSTTTTEKQLIQGASSENKDKKLHELIQREGVTSEKQEASSNISEVTTKESAHTESSTSATEIKIESMTKEVTESSVRKEDAVKSEKEIISDSKNKLEKKEELKESSQTIEKTVLSSPKEKSKKIEETIFSDVTPVAKESEQFVVQLDFGMDAPETPRVEDAPEFKKLDSSTIEEVKHTVSDSRLPTELGSSSSMTDYNKDIDKDDRLKRTETSAHETVMNQTTLVELSSKESIISVISDKQVRLTKGEVEVPSQPIVDPQQKQEDVIQKHETETLEKTIKESSLAQTKSDKESLGQSRMEESSIKTVIEMDTSRSGKPESESSTVRIISEKKEGKGDPSVSSVIYELRKDTTTRSATPGSDMEMESATPRSDLSSGQRSTTQWEASESRQELEHFESDEEIPGSPMSIASHIPSPPNFDYDLRGKDSAMTSSFYGTLPDEPDKKDTFAAMYISKYDEDSDIDPQTFSPSKVAVGPFEAKLSSERRDSINLNGTKDKEKSMPEPRPESSKDPIESWGKPLGLPPPPKSMRNFDWNPIVEWGHPLGLPSPSPPVKESNSEAELDLSNQSRSPTRSKIDKINAENERIASNIYSGKETINKMLKRSESPVKKAMKGDTKKNSAAICPIYLDLTYVPHHGNSHYADVEFFKKIRARYYVFSGTEPSKEVFNALLEAKQTWEDKDLEVTIIPTYDTDTLAYWVAENEETLMKNKIDLSPSASRCTINLQDHETSCSAYRLEF